ncbi:hypothetical protein C7B76_02590 [filamentous cyanobacterium CCP2]|nr:hypothetical protein C7B76_02590 [filamentous cyanobacterium CCP2]
MPWIYADSAVQEISDGVILYDLSKMRGVNAILSRIPQNLNGIYALYRRFSFNEKAFDDPEVFIAAILEEIYKDHCAEREGQLPPMYRVALRSGTTFAKADSLKRFAASKPFRKLVLTLLENSLVFQQPLYIGKATNLQNRIRNHLSEGSRLRERLSLAGHNIDQCRLLLVGISSEPSKLSDTDTENFDSELPEAEPELLVEDILSRLFLPSFTLRYG